MGKKSGIKSSILRKDRHSKDISLDPKWWENLTVYLVAELKNHSKLQVFMEDVHQTDNVPMLKFLEETDFSESSTGDPFIVLI